MNAIILLALTEYIILKRAALTEIAVFALVEDNNVIIILLIEKLLLGATYLLNSSVTLFYESHRGNWVLAIHRMYALSLFR